MDTTGNTTSATASGMPGGILAAIPGVSLSNHLLLLLSLLAILVLLLG